MRIVYTIALIAWILMGSFWSKKTFCGVDDKKKKDATTKVDGAAAATTTKGDCDRSLMFTDGDFKLKSTENFLFPQSKATLKQEPSAGMQNTLTKLADFLNENPGKSVQFAAYYHPKEQNPSDEDNLGIARAKTIKEYLVTEFGINESQIVIGSIEAKKACLYNNNILVKGAIATIGG